MDLRTQSVWWSASGQALLKVALRAEHLDSVNMHTLAGDAVGYVVTGVAMAESCKVAGRRPRALYQRALSHHWEAITVLPCVMISHLV